MTFLHFSVCFSTRGAVDIPSLPDLGLLVDPVDGIASVLLRSVQKVASFRWVSSSQQLRQPSMYCIGLP